MTVDPRDLRRSYVKTPQLVQTAKSLPTTPVNLSKDDWEGLVRLLEAMRQAINGQDGVSGEFNLTSTPLVIFDKGKLISIE